MSIYGPGKAGIALGNPAEVGNQFVEDALFQQCLFRGPDYGHVKEVAYKFELNSCGFGYFYFENRSKSQTFMIVVQLTEALLNCKFSSF